MPTKEEFEKHIKSIEERIKLIQNLQLDDAIKEEIIDELLERLSIATRYFLPDNEED